MMNYLYMQIGISPYTNNALSLINFMGKVMLIEGIVAYPCVDQCVRKSGTDIYELLKSANGQFEWILSDLSLVYFWIKCGILPPVIFFCFLVPL